jgi:hypothetical protein
MKIISEMAIEAASLASSMDMKSESVSKRQWRISEMAKENNGESWHGGGSYGVIWHQYRRNIMAAIIANESQHQ